MRVLVLHSRYQSGALSGENRVVDEEVALLRAAGHEVEALTPSPDDFGSPALALRSLVSAGAGRMVRETVRRGRFDVVHCHNVYPALGPRVLSAAAEGGAAVVLTLHNYRLLCIAATFFRDGHVCEDCLGRAPWPGVVHACYRSSRRQSAVLAGSTALARATHTLDLVDRFLAVSHFVRAKHVQAGFPPERLLVKPNVVPPGEIREGPGTYFLALSRLSVEKGLLELVRVWQPDLGVLRLVGDGPLRGEIERLAAERGIHLEGPASPQDVPALLAGARALLLPSACYEGQPRSAIEAYAAGVPVIASRFGALTELVDEGKTGLTVPPGEADGWRRAVRELADDATSVRLGRGALERWRESFSPERGLELLEAAYADALAARAQPSSSR